jgi:hypothetical protein
MNRQITTCRCNDETELQEPAKPDLELELHMPWILRFAIGWLFAFVIGAVMIAWA